MTPLMNSAASLQVLPASQAIAASLVLLASDSQASADTRVNLANQVSQGPPVYQEHLEHKANQVRQV